MSAPLTNAQARGLELVREVGELERYRFGLWGPPGEPLCSCCGTVHGARAVQTVTVYALERKGFLNVNVKRSGFEDFVVAGRATLAGASS